MTTNGKRAWARGRGLALKNTVAARKLELFSSARRRSSLSRKRGGLWGAPAAAGGGGRAGGDSPDWVAFQGVVDLRSDEPHGKRGRTRYGR